MDHDTKRPVASGYSGSMPSLRLAMFHPAFRTVGGADLLAARQARVLAADMAVEAVCFEWDEARWRELLAGVPVRVVAKRKASDLLFGLGALGKVRVRGARAERELRDFTHVLAHNHPASAMLGHMDLPGARLWYCHEPRRRLYPLEANPAMAARPEDAQGAWAFEDFQPESADPDLQAHDREGVARLQGVIANSAFTDANLRRIYGHGADAVIPPMVRFPERRLTSKGLRGPGLQLLLISRLGDPKNTDMVIWGFARFAAHHPESRLHIVGEGPSRLRLEALAGKLCEGRVQFHGFLREPELDGLRAACDAYVQLPLDEPFGMVFPEAAGAGLLLVGPDHGGPAEILEGGALGACVDAFDPEALAQALDRLAALPEAEVEALRERADAACRARYSEAVVGPALRAFVERY
ncbi:MAG TPA: glycosyltransferase family 4 protein [Holophagaceae bacterium]|nr:glycosyltransferase family 4 protein [Holophagaceae bacterium]